jgi:ATP-dependent helicase/nuclease subunit A
VIPDQHQRERALDPGRSFIIQAPAGSGKTGLLTQRYLRLLSTVQRPESIVAMTFTRKAAAEMKERIRCALSDAASKTRVRDDYARRTRELAQAALQANRKHNWNLLSDPARLQVQTIDSLCAMLTRQMPVISEFGGIGEVVENARDLYRLAARRMLTNLTESTRDNRELFRRAALHFDNDIAKLERQIAQMLEKRDQWRALSAGGDSQLIGDFRRLLDEAHGALLTVLRERASVDFTEVTRAAIRALGAPEQPTDLLYWLDYRIQHLLVDEFQDTSRAQYDLVKALTEQWSEGDDHTLFVVGDPLQSIYRFREAEVSLFLKCWDGGELGSVRLERLQLTANFRSTAEIVDWTTATFGPVMAEDNEAEGAVKLEPAQAVRERSENAPELIPFIGDEGEQEAHEIVRILQDLRPGKNAAILVRSRTQIIAILPALRAAGIAYEAVEIDELKEQQHIIDLISLTRALVHVGDRVAWLACLRAPWCGLTLADFSVLVEAECDRAVLDLLSDPERIAALSSEGRSRAVRIQEILSDAVSSVGRVALRSLVEQTWLRLGGPAILHETNQQEDVDCFLELLESFDEGGIVRDFSLLQERLAYLYARPAARGVAVQVMTIHQAKGLEFDTVIVPQLGRSAKATEKELLIWVEEADGLAIAAQPQRGEDDAVYERINDIIKRKEQHELKRLFYVACTRAIDRLYLLGNVTVNKNGGLRTPSSNTFLGLIWSTAEPVFQAAFERRAPAQASLFDIAGQPRRVLRRLPRGWRAPVFDPSIAWQPELRRAAASERTPTYEWVSDTGRHVGSVVHALLKQAAESRANLSAPLIRSELLRLGVSRTEEPNASAKVMEALGNTFSSERGRWILARHAQGRSEWPIAGRLNDKLFSGTIDRVFRDEQDRLWIVDYKTSEHEGGSRELFLSEQQRRYRPQLDSYAMLMSRMERGPIWLGLYFPLLDAWLEWQFEAEAALAAQYTGAEWQPS